MKNQGFFFLCACSFLQYLTLPLAIDGRVLHLCHESEYSYTANPATTLGQQFSKQHFIFDNHVGFVLLLFY